MAILEDVSRNNLNTSGLLDYDDVDAMFVDDGFVMTGPTEEEEGNNKKAFKNNDTYGGGGTARTSLSSSLSSKTSEESMFSFGIPKIRVQTKMEDWCVLQLSRGTTPRALMGWISNNRSLCFDFPDLVYTSCSSSSSDDADDPGSVLERKRKIEQQEFNPTLANPHYSAYAQSLILVARNPAVLKTLKELRLTVHCLVKGHHKPRSEIKCRSVVDGKRCCTTAVCLDVVPSNTAGNISLLAASNDQPDSAWIAPNQFQRHLKAGGWPVLGNTNEAHAFRGEPLCISAVRLDFVANGINQKHSVCIPPVLRLRCLLEREERLWRERKGQEELRVELFRAEISKPAEYLAERAVFSDLEFRVTPAVMIPRNGSETLVDRAVKFYNGQDNDETKKPRPIVLDLGTGCGNLLISTLHRLQHQNATGVGIDSSREALEIADYNLAALGLNKTAKTIQGRFEDLRYLNHEPFNIVLCNPPHYTRDGRRILDASSITHEPEEALFVEADDDPLVHYRVVLTCLDRARLVAPGGLLVFEVYRDNADAVARLMDDFGLTNIQICTDANSTVRTAEGTYAGKLGDHGEARIMYSC